MLTIEKARRDFLKIWKRNLTKITLEKAGSLVAGDWLHEDEQDVKETKVIDANIQPVSDYEVEQMEFGLMERADYSVYVRWDEEIEPYDYVIFNGQRYKIVNMSTGWFQGHVVYKKFNLQRIEDE